MPIDALTLGIGLQGKHDFSLDGLKYQIAAHEKAALADAKKKQKAYDSWDNTMKKAVGMTDNTKIRPYLQKQAESDVMAFIDRSRERRASGEFQGMDDIRDLMDLQSKLGRYKNESATWDKVSNIPQEVQAHVMDRDGGGWLTTKGQYFGVNSAPDGDGGFISSYPTEGMVDLDALEKIESATIPKESLGEQIGKPEYYSLGDKQFASYKLGMSPDIRKEFEQGLYDKVVNNKMALLSFVVREGYGQGLTPDMLTAGPGGAGVTLNPEMQGKVRSWATSVADKITRNREQSRVPKAVKQSEFDKKTKVGQMTTTKDSIVKGSTEYSRPYFPKSGGQAPKSFEVTEDVMVVDNSSSTGLSKVGHDEVGVRVTGLEKSPMEITNRDGVLYFEYTGANETYYVGLSQKSFTEFVLNSGDSPENIRDYLVEVNQGNDIAELNKYREFIGSAYTDANKLVDEWKGTVKSGSSKKTGASEL